MVLAAVRQATIDTAYFKSLDLSGVSYDNGGDGGAQGANDFETWRQRQAAADVTLESPDLSAERVGLTDQPGVIVQQAMNASLAATGTLGQHLGAERTSEEMRERHAIVEKLNEVREAARS